MRGKMIVWALFDSETCTVAKALPEHEVYSFGIGGGTEHIHLDLSDFNTARKELDKYPKPDAIFASPPCESWVGVNVGNIKKLCRKYEDPYVGALNMYWKSKWEVYPFMENDERRINGINTAITTARIIQHYKPEFWAIENGASSLIFSYMYKFAGLNGIKNKCKYCNYGFNVLKPTVIYSNKNLMLNNTKSFRVLDRITHCRGKLKPGQKHLSNGYYTRNGEKKNLAYALISRVPLLLYRSVIQQFMQGGQPTLFPPEETA
jgi:hypothetical protein